jgi:hypothetical protein
MTDKYCLLLVFVCISDIAASKPYVHNHGFFQTPNSSWWTPEDTWLER